MRIISKKFGEFEGKDVVMSTLYGENDNYVSIINWGAVIQNWVVKMPNNEINSVVLGFDDFDYYPKLSPFFGAIVGRVANRIANAKFEINNKTYNLEKNRPPNHLHGGSNGFGRSIWEFACDEKSNSIILKIDSPDGHGGYPGNVKASVKYTLEGEKLIIEMKAKSDSETPINMAQHNYFNLSSNKINEKYNVCDHFLYINSHLYTETDKLLIPTGKILKTTNTDLDFSKPKKINKIFLDDNFVLNSDRVIKDPVANLYNLETLMELQLWTDQPGLQVYNSPKLSLNQSGLNKIRYGNFSGICLEAQKFPDSVNNPNFPSILIDKTKDYYHKTEIKISEKK